MRAIPLALASAVAFGGVSGGCLWKDGSRTRDISGPRRSGELYDLHCAVCHGDTGTGQGPAAPFLFPPPTNFTHGNFRWVGTQNAIASEEDILRTLERGLPGSAMPSWSWLPDEDLRGLARFVRELAMDGLVQRHRDEAFVRGNEMSEAEARERLRGILDPSPPLDVPAADALGDLDHGRELYLASCANCHGAEGTGQREPLWDEQGDLDWPRDFTAGFLRGGSSIQDLYRRIHLGMPGSAMLPTALTPKEGLDLASYVHSLIPPGSDERYRHRRSTLTARRVEAVPSSPGDPLWEDVPAVQVVLAPLWWKQGSILEARLQAVHDGKHIALRVHWPDETGNNRPYSEGVYTDGAALQFSQADAPPLFGMGAPDQPTNLWHWQALRLEEVAGVLDIEPHALSRSTLPGEVRLDTPVYRPALDQPQISDTVGVFQARGIDGLEVTGEHLDQVYAQAEWEAGHWSVVFRRSMLPVAQKHVSFRPDAPMQVACAIWNGAAGDSTGQKSISIWQRLTLEP